MEKQYIVLTILMIINATLGVVLIYIDAGLNAAIGVYMLIWANNVGFKLKEMRGK